MLLAIALVVLMAAVVGLTALVITGGPDWEGIDSGEVRATAGIGLAILIPIIVIGLLLLRLLYRTARRLTHYYVVSMIVGFLIVACGVAFVIWW